MVGSWRVVFARFFASLLVLAAGMALATESDVRRVWQMLDYLAVDYGGAVKGGVVISASEYSEMQEFAAASRTKLAALEDREGCSLDRGYSASHRH